MSEFGGFRKRENNPACTKNTRAVASLPESGERRTARCITAIEKRSINRWTGTGVWTRQRNGRSRDGGRPGKGTWGCNGTEEGWILCDVYIGFFRLTRIGRGRTELEALFFFFFFLPVFSDGSVKLENLLSRISTDRRRTRRE